MDSNSNSNPITIADGDRNTIPVLYRVMDANGNVHDFTDYDAYDTYCLTIGNAILAQHDIHPNPNRDLDAGAYTDQHADL
jgi:hypothetical protein